MTILEFDQVQCACGWQVNVLGEDHQAVFWGHVDDGTCPFERDEEGNVVTEPCKECGHAVFKRWK